MAKLVRCIKLGIESESLDMPPFPGEKGQQIYESVCKKAWKEWLNIQTMLINEHRLKPFEPEAKKFLEQEREKFLFGDSTDLPEDYVPPS